MEEELLLWANTMSCFMLSQPPSAKAIILLRILNDPFIEGPIDAILFPSHSSSQDVETPLLSVPHFYITLHRLAYQLIPRNRRMWEKIALIPISQQFIAGTSGAYLIDSSSHAR